LKAGYTVIGTSRTASKAAYVKNYFDKTYPGKFSIYESGDLEKAGAFDEAVKDVDAIAHVASPVSFTTEDPIRDVINPAINGTLSLLQSAHKYGENVKHVVITSSIASVMDKTLEKGHAYTEKDWNDSAMKTVLDLRSRGEAVDGFLAYVASKNEAERAVWRFKKEHNPAFTLATILPAFVYGPILPPPENTGAVKAASTANFIVDFYSGENKDPSLAIDPAIFVDDVDVARAHVLAIQQADKANGERYLLSAGPYSFQNAADILRENFPERKDIIAEGTPGNYKDATMVIDGSKVTRELGLEYTDFKEAVLDTVNSVKHLY